ncbi:MAG: hypothetical protein RLY61_601 [Candidatus Parcubacteria bacterium]
MLISFITLWTGAGISITSVEKISKKVNISSFLVSFFALGALTSLSEISVAFFSLVDNTPEISVGNLIGGSAILILLVIPLLAVLNKTVTFNEQAGLINFPLSFLVISLPVFFVLDKKLTLMEAFFLLVSFAFLAFTISTKNTLLARLENAITKHSVSTYKELIKILFGVFLIVMSSKFIVDTTILYAGKYSLSPFVLGLVLLSFGTNLPELSILARSTLLKKKNIALGDYLGSATINTLILGFLTLGNGSPINLTTGIKYNLLLLPLGAGVLLYFIRNKKLERGEGLILLGMFSLFMLLEFLL